jgi:hypothetical protein
MNLQCALSLKILIAKSTQNHSFTIHADFLNQYSFFAQKFEFLRKKTNIFAQKNESIQVLSA